MNSSRPSLKSFLVRHQTQNGYIVDSVPKPVQFDESNDRYRCMCGCFHIKSGSFIVVAVEVLMILIFLINSSLVYIQQNPPKQNDNTTATYTPISFTVSMVGFGIAGFILFIAFIGIAKNIAALLIPHLAMQIITMICLLLLIISGIIAVSTDSSLFYRLLNAAPFDDHPKNNSVSLSSETLARMYTLLTGYIITFILQIWFVIIIHNCYKYYLERKAYMNYCLAYSTPMKTLNCR
uniref:MARVEL domain-containing protein n=1 Tax=Parastrongyloides trichosuri TaxID=131310 RepID=A0A0N4Z540_PARTI